MFHEKRKKEKKKEISRKNEMDNNYTNETNNRKV